MIDINLNQQPDMVQEIPMKKWTRYWKFILPSLAILLLGGAGAGYYYYNSPTDHQANTKNEVESLVAQVSQLIILPSHETPTVATVSDPDKLKGQAFFVNAQQGDKVLIYSTAKKAILYRPDSKKIIEVAPINLGNPTPAPSSSALP